MELIRTAEDICAEIADKRTAAKRLSRHDPRRDQIDAEVDALVDDWLLLNRDAL